MSIEVKKKTINKAIEEGIEKVAKEKDSPLETIVEEALVRYLEDEEDKKALEEYRKNKESEELLTHEEFMKSVFENE